ncbi:MAG: hypothetical protein AUG02_01585 [Chloroflexi bacterium 13_1_20CM_2_70_9]|nr:MAG: hypothetical protein AUG02_01585 [Chloroflexi bacterium 13_1_20CM_2_70_9]
MSSALFTVKTRASESRATYVSATPFAVVSYAPPVVGKSVDVVEPATKASPEGPSAIPPPGPVLPGTSSSMPLPPRYVAKTKEAAPEAPVLTFITK